MNKRIKEIYIEAYRNLRNLRLKFVKHGITIIIGKNNVGKTHILDYVYKENEKWDGFNDEYIENLYKPFSLFFEREDFVVVPKSHPHYVNKETKGEIKCSYDMHYFDLETSIFPLMGEQGEINFEKVRTRECILGYTDDNIEVFWLRSAIMETKEENKLTLWKPNYKDKNNFVKHVEEDGTEKYRGFNKAEWVCHSLKTVGSGFLKYQTLKSLITQLLEKYKNKAQQISRPVRVNMEKEIVLPFLLIDEPELLLHPSLISDIAQSVKDLEKNNITTVLTSHSPDFLSHFVSGFFTDREANLVIIQKDKDGSLRETVYFCDWVREEENKEKIINKWLSYCQCFRKELEKRKGEGEIDELYYNQWKSILNKHTLKLFFSKEVLFVEGLSDYILLANEIIEKKLDELEKKGKIKLEIKAEKKRTLSEKFKEKTNDDDKEIDYSQNHQWLKKETRMINNVTFGEFDEERFTELGLALGKIINQIAQQE